MTPFLLNMLCEPETGEKLKLVNPEYDGGNIAAGQLVSTSGRIYEVRNGIPRFVENLDSESVSSFGDEWNYFNFVDFKTQWLEHTVKNTFGSTEFFKDKIIVDAGGGSGAQTKWFLEYGAKHVILMDLSHSVDDVVIRNIKGFDNVDVIQCSIDAPPLRSGSINGLVYCHNVIQHTPSVERTAKALWDIVGEGGEFVFNCYQLNNQGFLRYLRFHLIYMNLRRVLSKMPFKVVFLYATIFSTLRLIPILGEFLEKSSFVIQGDVPKIEDESVLRRLKRRFKAAQLNTFDAYGSHQFQHHKSDFEILSLAISLQNDASKIRNLDRYFARPRPIGMALRLTR